MSIARNTAIFGEIFGIYVLEFSSHTDQTRAKVYCGFPSIFDNLLEHKRIMASPRQCVSLNKTLWTTGVQVQAI